MVHDKVYIFYLFYVINLNFKEILRSIFWGDFFSVNLNKDDPIWSKDMRLRINGTGQVLHVYANGEYVGRITFDQFFGGRKSRNYICFLI